MKQFFAVFFRPGPRWIKGKTIFEQPLDGHVAHIHHLSQCDKVLMAGPLADSSGGLTLLQVDDEREARMVIEQDPNVADGVLLADIRPWAPIAWDQGVEENVLYEVPPLLVQRDHPPYKRA